MAENLSYAFATINPQSYDEFTFVATCGWEAGREYADEYERRKNGRPPQLPDHPLFSLDWCLMPDTQRILVFPPRANGIFVHCAYGATEEGQESLSEPIIRDEISFYEFVTRVNAKFKTMLSQEELKTIYEGVRHYASYARPYIGRSAIVNHAFRKRLSRTANCMMQGLG